MSAFDFTSLPERVLNYKNSRESLSAPQVVKAGSGSSPGVLSPGTENDFFLSTSAAATAPSVSKFSPNVPEYGLLGSTAKPLPPSQLAGSIPLFSPSEGLYPQQQLAATIATAEARARRRSSIFGNLNHSMEFSLPTPPDCDVNQLRLPSFELLGIANPHPDDFKENEEKRLLDKRLIDAILPDQISTSPSFQVRPSLCKSNMRDLGLGSMPAPSLGPAIEIERPSFLPVTPCSPRPALSPPDDVLTPPDETNNMNIELPWRLPVDQMSSGVPAGARASSAGSGQSTAGQAGSSGAMGTTATSAIEEDDDAIEEDSPAWLEDAIANIISSINAPTLRGRALQVLSHALPSPSLPGHAFPKIIDRIRAQSPSTSTTWVNLLHAVPGRFNLADLPTTPPATPGMPLGGGDDYFTTKVFASAVTAVDYDSTDIGTPTAIRPHHPLAAPESINLSIVERYIPPTSAAEFASLFNARSTTPSLLVDRLVELAPGNGCLVFIYPTLAGAHTFTEKYLGPVLDPLLRSMVVVNGFSADLSESLGRMTAVDRLLDFSTMRTKANALCAELNGDSRHVRALLQAPARQGGTFSLVYAEPHKVQLERNVWADWWCKQEKVRVRAAVSRYFRQARNGGNSGGSGPGKDGDGIGSSGAHLMPIELIQEVLEGVEKRKAELGMDGIEVGVFVIRRG